jgi:Restriction endonuclease
MPKRSNQFQRLVYAIQHTLTKEAVLTESKFLTNTRTGSQVEVDVVIEAQTGSIPLIISIECTAPGRAATVEWVREMLGKHEDLPTDKLVLVSSSGFSQEAKEIAAAHRIEIISWKDAQSFNWSQIIASLVANPNLRIASFQIHVKSWSLKFDLTERPRLGEKRNLSFSVSCELFSPEGRRLGSVQELGTSMLQNRITVERIMRRWIKTKKEEFKLSWKPPKGTQVSDLDSNRYLIEGFMLDGFCEVESVPMTLAPATYGEIQVAYGSVPDIFSGSTGQAMVLFTEQEGEEAKGWLAFSSDSGFSKRIFPAIRPSTLYDSS